MVSVCGLLALLLLNHNKERMVVVETAYSQQAENREEIRRGQGQVVSFKAVPQ